MHKAHGDPERFRDFIINRMGQREFDILKIRAYAPQKLDLTLMNIMLKKLLGEE